MQEKQQYDQENNMYLNREALPVKTILREGTQALPRRENSESLPLHPGMSSGL